MCGRCTTVSPPLLGAAATLTRLGLSWSSQRACFMLGHIFPWKMILLLCGLDCAVCGMHASVKRRAQRTCLAHDALTATIIRVHVYLYSIISYHSSLLEKASSGTKTFFRPNHSWFCASVHITRLLLFVWVRHAVRILLLYCSGRIIGPFLCWRTSPPRLLPWQS